MPPARRQLKALGSLQLVGHANNPTKVITELAFITDERTNNPGDLDAPLEIQFDEFMDGVNTRGKGAHIRQRKVTIEQAAAVLLVTVQKGHVELIAKQDDPHAIDVIKILPKAKRILASFLPKLRGYGDIPYDQQYRGAIALAKRHFFPKGKAPTKKELMALLLQSYQEKRELGLQRQNLAQRQTLGIQTSFVGSLSRIGMTISESAPTPAATFSNVVRVPNQSSSQRSAEQPDNNVDTESTAVASEMNTLGDDNDVFPELEAEPIPLVVHTPVAPRSLNPYATPISNPRQINHVPFVDDASPILANGSQNEVVLGDDDSADDDVREMLQVTATSQGRLKYYYARFKLACGKVRLLKEEKEEIEREFDLTKKKLDETEQHLREANADRSRLRRWVDSLRHRIDTICSQVGLLREMASSNTINGEEWATDGPESQGGFDSNPI